MQVSVEHNDSKRNQENSVCWLEPRHFVSIAVAVAARKRLQANRFILLNITQTNWFYRSFWSLASDNQWPPFKHLLPLVTKQNFWGNWHAKCLPVTRQSLSKHWTKHAINPWFTDAPTLVWGGGIKVLLALQCKCRLKIDCYALCRFFHHTNYCIFHHVIPNQNTFQALYTVPSPPPLSAALTHSNNWKNLKSQ